MGGFLGGYTSSSAIGGGVIGPSTFGSGHINWSPIGIGYPAIYPGGQPGHITIQLMDANGMNWQIPVDPALIQLINTINQAHASKLGVQQHGYTPTNPPPPPKLPPIEDFSLDEIAQAEELMEELCGAA